MHSINNYSLEVLAEDLSLFPRLQNNEKEWIKDIYGSILTLLDKKSYII